MFPIGDDNEHSGIAFVTIALIVLNVVAFLHEINRPEQAVQAFIFAWGVVPREYAAATDLPPLIPLPYWSTILTSMFLHGGWGHLGGNMLFLWIFGDNVEDRMGHGRFVFFYLICGFAAAMAQTLMSPNSLVPMVGASGAIAGVMGAYLVLYPHSRILMLFPFPPIMFELPAVLFLVMWFLVQFLNGINQLPVFEKNAISGGVAFWAHVVGFVMGLLLVVVLKRPERTKVEWWDTIQP